MKRDLKALALVLAACTLLAFLVNLTVHGGGFAALFHAMMSPGG